jgi:hypothetical protein
LSRHNTQHSTIVLCEDWPSITLVLQGIGFDVDTYITNTSVANDLELGCMFQSSPKLMKEFANVLSGPIDVSLPIWIQGSRSFTNNLLDTLPSRFVNVIAIAPKSHRENLIRISDPSSISGLISHACVGGITLSRWSYLMPHALHHKEMNKVTRVQRRLKHILDHTQKGIPYGSSKLNDKKRKLGEGKVYTGDSRIVPGSAKITVATHSVLQSTTPLIKRYISNQELLNIYDIQTHHQDILLRLSQQKLHCVLNSLVQSVPEKVVYRLGYFIHQSLNRHKETHQLQSGKTNSRGVEKLEWLKYMMIIVY